MSRRPNRYPNPAGMTNTPKSQRGRIVLAPVPPLVDYMKTLGHPPRSRKPRRYAS